MTASTRFCLATSNTIKPSPNGSMTRGHLAYGALPDRQQQQQQHHHHQQHLQQNTHRLRRPQAVTPSALLRLPTDIWLHIFVHLASHAAPTLAKLGTTCKHLLQLVDQHGWKQVLHLEYSSVSISRLDQYYQDYAHHARSCRKAIRSQSWFACRYASWLEKCWFNVMLRPGSVLIPSAERRIANNHGALGRGARSRSDFAIPTLTLGTRWIVVGVRSELFIYPARPAAGKEAQPLAKIRLHSHVQSDGQSTNADSSTSDDPWQDITALKALDPDASVLAIGYANGCVQVVALTSKDGKRDIHADVVHHFASAQLPVRRQEVAAISVHRGCGASKADAFKDSDFIASITKRGHLQIHTLASPCEHASDQRTVSSWQIDSQGDAAPTDGSPPDSCGTNTPARSNFRSAAFNNAPLAPPQNAAAPTASCSTRAWSVLLGNCTVQNTSLTWIAVGMTAEHAVHIYPLSHHGGRVSLAQPFHVAGTGQRTSVYAMATPPAESSLPAFLLFVGFYSGEVRVYDMRKLLDAEHAEGDGWTRTDEMHEALPSNEPWHRRRRAVKRRLDPIAIFRDDYDMTAIYGLSFGGPRATWLVVGGAQFAKMRVFDVGMLANYEVPLLAAPGEQPADTNWTVFALTKTNTPLYHLVAQADRVVGVTDTRLWWLDFGSSILDHQPSEHCSPARAKAALHTVAYFRHSGGCLSTTQPVYLASP